MTPVDAGPLSSAQCHGVLSRFFRSLWLRWVWCCRGSRACGLSSRCEASQLHVGIINSSLARDQTSYPALSLQSYPLDQQGCPPSLVLLSVRPRAPVGSGRWVRVSPLNSLVLSFKRQRCGKQNRDRQTDEDRVRRNRERRGKTGERAVERGLGVNMR